MLLRSHVVIVAVIVILLLVVYLWHSKRSRPKLKIKIRQEPTLGMAPLNVAPEVTTESIPEPKSEPIQEPISEPISEPTPVTVESPPKTATNTGFDPNTIIIKIRANPGRPFMGYELLQTLLANNLRFGEMHLFHRYEHEDGAGATLFSLAAATRTGTFELNNMGAFSGTGLVMFMQLGHKKKLMNTFDLMLDTARQLIEDLGGELLDLHDRPLDAAIIKQWRERICTFEEKNLYTADLLDNL